MSTMTRQTASVKTTRTIFAPSMTRSSINPRFGVGIARPDREKRVGYTVSDAAWWAAQNETADASAAETRAEFMRTTLSRDELLSRYADEEITRLRCGEVLD